MTSNYSIDVKFNDNLEAIYYPGQTVKGLNDSVSTDVLD